MSSRDVMEHLFSCFDTTYLVLGESAPTLSNDAYVIRAYETARAMGEVALRFRDYLGEVDVAPLAPLAQVLRQAVADDGSGAMVLFAVASVAGPRILVSLRDARATEDLDATAHEVLSEASEVLIRETRAVADVAPSQAALEDLQWQEGARGLALILDQSGNAESFGLSR